MDAGEEVNKGARRQGGANSRQKNMNMKSQFHMSAFKDGFIFEIKGDSIFLR